MYLCFILYLQRKYIWCVHVVDCLLQSCLLQVVNDSTQTKVLVNNQFCHSNQALISTQLLLLSEVRVEKLVLSYGMLHFFVQDVMNLRKQLEFHQSDLTHFRKVQYLMLKVSLLNLIVNVFGSVFCNPCCMFGGHFTMVLRSYICRHVASL